MDTPRPDETATAPRPADVQAGGRAGWAGELAGDLRVGARGLVKHPGFAVVAMLTLGLGLGANTAVFSVIKGVVLEPLPYEHGDRLVLIRQAAPLANQPDVGVSIKELYDFREQLASFEELVEFHEMNFDLLRRGDPHRVAAGVVSAGFFDVLGIRPLLGRTFLASDDQPGAEAVLVLGHAFWQARFGSDPGIVGQVFEMNDRQHTVVGVLPALPMYPNDVDIYLPSSACPFRVAAERQIAQNRRAFPALRVFGLIKPGVAREVVAAEVAAAGDRFRQDFPDVYRPESGFQSRTAGVLEELTANARPVLLLLLGTAALVLLVACANVATLALARVLRRERELATRTALGAGRGRLVRQLLAESMLVALCGGAVGLAFAWATLDLLAAFAGRFTQRTDAIGVDAGVLLFAVGLSTASGLVFGMLPALKARVDLAGALKAGARSGGDAPESRRMQAWLTMAQVAVSVVLLVGAGLLLASVSRLQQIDPGYRAGDVMTAEIFGNFSRYPDAASLRRFYGDVLARLEGTPGVQSAAISNGVPLSGLQPGQTRFRIEGLLDAALAPSADVRIASPSYFETLRIPVPRGRAFDVLDHEQAERVVIVNEAAVPFWNGLDPIGSRVSADDGRTWYTVVGIAGNVRQFGLDRDAVAQLYLPLAQAPAGLAGRVLVRMAGDPAGAVPAIRAAVRAVDPDMPIENVRTLDDLRAASLAAPRLTALLLSLFAVLALAVALTGVAGVMATSVSERTRELGVRMAIGASRAQVVAMVLGRGLALVGAGVAAGMVLSIAAGRALDRYLFDTAPADPLVLTGVALVIAAAATLACLAPAWRAASVDPLDALRAD